MISPTYFFIYWIWIDSIFPIWDSPLTSLTDCIIDSMLSSGWSGTHDFWFSFLFLFISRLFFKDVVSFSLILMRLSILDRSTVSFCRKNWSSYFITSILTKIFWYVVWSNTPLGFRRPPFGGNSGVCCCGFSSEISWWMLVICSCSVLFCSRSVSPISLVLRWSCRSRASISIFSLYP